MKTLSYSHAQKSFLIGRLCIPQHIALQYAVAAGVSLFDIVEGKTVEVVA